MIIDVHNHPDWHHHNVEKFIENMDMYNIDITWILSWECPPSEYSPSYNKNISPLNQGKCIPFDNCLRYKEKYPDRFVLGYAPDPREPDAIDKMDAAITIHGARVYGELKLRMIYDNRDAIRMYKFCGEKKVPVLVHIDYEFDTGRAYPRPNYWYGGGIEAFERAIAECENTVFIGHAPGFWAHISGDDQYKTVAYPKGKVVEGGKLIQMLNDYPNLYCDISAGSGCNALKRDPEFALWFLNEYQDRIMYGRDYFDNQHQEFLESLNLSQEVKDKIYFKNALKLVPLDNVKG
jgi:predicted TIM-barrel fold metal-dependent hydrolase